MTQLKKKSGGGAAGAPGMDRPTLRIASRLFWYGYLYFFYGFWPVKIFGEGARAPGMDSPDLRIASRIQWYTSKSENFHFAHFVFKKSNQNQHFVTLKDLLLGIHCAHYVLSGIHFTMVHLKTRMNHP